MEYVERLTTVVNCMYIRNISEFRAIMQLEVKAFI